MNALRRGLFTFALCALAVAPLSAATPGWTSDYNHLLGKYVTPNGVKYAEWKKNAADMQTLQKVVDGIAQERVSSLDKNAQLAFYLNAYNAWILHEALEKYPTRSVKDLFFTFFTSKRIKVAGEQTSFNDLEKQTIRSKFSDPHVHFALNCASQSCPPLNREAFEGATVDAQMEKLAKAFVNSEKGVRLTDNGKTAELSKIFDWYKGDFKDGGPIEFINKRREHPIAKGAKITYQDYDWSLNEVK